MAKLKTLFSFLILSAVLVSGSGVAEDTEIYFGNATASGSTVRPNVLFVLDTSSSMNNLDGGSTTRLDRMKQALHSILDSSTDINVGLMRFHTMGGPVLYPISHIDADANLLEGTTSTDSDVVARITAGSNDGEEDVAGSVLLSSDKLEMGEVAGGTPTSLEVRVNASADDAEERANNGNMDVTSTDLELPKEGNTQQIIGMRFKSVAIPAGATITSASIEFVIDETKTGEDKAVALDIWVQDADSPAQFTSTNGNISARPRNGTPVRWSDLPFPAVNDTLTTPDLSTLVQLLVNRAGWGASDKSMVFIMQHATGGGNRTVEAFDGDNAKAPVLRVTYQSGAAGPQVVALRFTDVGIPQGATINSATLEFTAGNIDTTNTALKISAEAADNSAVLAATTGNLSGRTKTANLVPWDSVSTPVLAQWTDTDVSHVTPDLKAVIKEVTDRTGWCGGNAITILIEKGSVSAGKRAAIAYEGDSTKAPLLRVDYDYDFSSPPTGTTGCINQTITSQVSASNDDAEQRADNTMYLDSTDLEMVTDGGVQKVGVRFRNLNIPQGANVISADITFTVDEANSEATSLTIAGHNADNAAGFSTSPGDISGRGKTGNTVPWTSLPAWAVGETHKTPDLKTIVGEIVGRTGWVPGNSMVFIIEGSGKRVAKSWDGSPASAPRLRVKIEGSAGGGTTTLTTVRSRLKNIVDELQYKTGTPILSTLVEAARYYRGETVIYGKQRGDAGSRSEYSRVSHFLSYCTVNETTGAVTCPGADTTGYGPHGVQRTGSCSAENPTHVDCRSENVQGAPVYRSPIADACQGCYIILLSDGLGYISGSETGVYEPTQYVHSMVGNGNNCSDHDTCAKDLVRSLKNADQGSPDGDQFITTFTIGFNLQSTDTQFLRDLATAGGGSFHEASSAAELASVFQNIINEISNAPSSFTAPALSVNAFNRLFNRNEVYLALFKPSDTVSWIGNVKKYKLCNNELVCTPGELLDANNAPAVGVGGKIKDTAQSLWSTTNDGSTVDEGGAGSKIPTYDQRVVYTYTGTSDSPNSPVALSGTAHLVNTTNSAITKTMLGDAAMSDTRKSEIISWMRGKDVKDEDGDNNTNENRWAFHDPLHSRPIPVTYGAPLCTTADTNNSASFCYKRTTSTRNADKAVIKLLVGTNDGGIRMINSSNGIEQWIFFPSEVLAMQGNLMDNAAGNHLYGLDGNPVVWIQDKSRDGNNNIIDDPDGVIDTNDGDFVRVIFGMRRGGRNLYALDITPSSVLTAETTTNDITPKFMWRIKGGTGDFASLGQSWSTPILTPIRVKKTTGNAGDSESKSVLIMGGGYDTIQDGVAQNLAMADDDEIYFGSSATGNAIYIIDPVDGSRYWWASNVGSGATLELNHMNYSIPGDIAAYDSNGDGETDRLYATDVGGQVWRIDLVSVLTKNTKSGSTGGRLAALSDYAVTPAEADKRKFFYSVDVVQLRESQYSQAKDYDIIPVISGNRSHPLDLDIRDRVFGLRDYLVEDNITMDNAGNPTNYPQCVTGTVAANDLNTAFCGNGVTLTTSALYNATSNAIQNNDANAIVALKQATGWYFDLAESNGDLIGEKGLSKPVTLGGILFFTTFYPTQDTNNTCGGSEGSGRVYGVKIENAAAVLDFDGNGVLATTDRYKYIGGGIPSDVVPVFQESGVRILIGTSAGAVPVETNIGVPRDRTFWFQNQ